MEIRVENNSEEDLRDLKLVKTEMFVHEIMYSALKKLTNTDSLESNLKKKLLFLMNPVKQEDLPKLENQLGLSSNQLSTTNSAEKESVNFLALSSEMLTQLNTDNFTRREISLIQDLYFKELSKLLKELSECVIEFDSEAFPGSIKCLQPFQESNKLTKDIRSHVLNNNTEIKNYVQLQNNLISLKNKIIPGKELKRIESYEKELKDTLTLASELHEKTLNFIYPTEDFNDKMNEAVSSLEQELSEINKSIEELSHIRDLYQGVDKKELNSIKEEYKQVTSQRKMLEMTLRELNTSLLSNTSISDF